MAQRLTPEQEDLVRRILNISEHTDAEDVVDEALRRLEERQQRLIRLRAAIAEGDAAIARGDVYEWTPELRDEIFGNARAAAKAGKRPKPDVCP
jgi:hypothetical protein